VVGNGMDPSASKKQEERVLNYIQIGKGAGAEIATQGNLPSDPSMQEWIFRFTNNIQERHVDMKVVQREIFGSVVTVTSFETKEKGVSITNEPRHGLVSYVYTRDHEKPLHMSRKIDAGVVFLNNNYQLFLGTPFDGPKESGYGREHCIETLCE
jgi:acyl-CoA reductase-like NAD-dependent aldehyde dehydrogenase